MRIAVTGSKSLVSYPNVINAFLRCSEEVIVGDSKGIDQTVYMYGITNGLNIKILAMPATFGSLLFDRMDAFTQAEYRARDKELLDHGDMVIAIWDGKSESVEGNIKYAHSKGKPLIVFDSSAQKLFTFNMDVMSDDDKTGVKAIFRRFEGTFSFGNDFILAERDLWDNIVL